MRLYRVFPVDGDYALPIIAENGNEAKLLGFSEMRCGWGAAIDFIDVRVKWMKNANIEGLPYGIVAETEELVRRNICNIGEGGTCDLCDAWDVPVSHYLGQAVCDECIVEEVSKQKGVDSVSGVEDSLPPQRLGEQRELNRSHTPTKPKDGGCL